jgi:predicted Holliday junction resolvase-like endonuclease
MKKKFLTIAILAIVVSMSSCGSSSSFESDVRKKADYMCKVQKLSAATDEKSVKDLADVKKEMDEFDEKMEKKYKDKKNDDASNATAQKIMTEVMGKCK